MGDSGNAKNGTGVTDRAMLQMLSVLEEDKQVSQRSLAARIGVALGLTNSLLKRAARKGLVKVQEVPAKRFAYYVTPKGFSEKSRLVADYLSSSLEFFREVRGEYLTLFAQMEKDGVKQVVLYGSGELAEIATLAVQGSQVEILGIVEPGANVSSLGGMAVFPTLDHPEVQGADRIVISHAAAPQDSYELVLEHFDDGEIIAPACLHISRNRAEGEG